MNRRLALLASVKTAGDNATMEQKTILDTTNFSKEPGKNMVHLTILCKSLAMKTKRIIEWGDLGINVTEVQPYSAV